MKKKMLVVPGNTDLNRGDQALVWESINVMKEIIPDIEVYLYNAGANEDEIHAQKKQTVRKGYKFLDRILQHPRSRERANSTQISYGYSRSLKWGFIAIWDLFVTILLLFPFKFVNQLGLIFLNSNQSKTYKTFADLDYLIVKGGGFLHSYGKMRDAYIMYFFLFDLLLAHKMGAKILIFPNSIGPLKNTLSKKIVLHALSKASFISLREEVSYNYVKNTLGLECRQYPDLGFYLKSKKIDILKGNLLTDKKKYFKKIAITLRPYRFDGQPNPDNLYRQYIGEITKLIEKLQNSGCKITLVAHTLGPSAHEDDRLAIRDVKEQLSKETLEAVDFISDFNMDCKDIQSLYAQYDLVIGTRFHSVIFALNECTPAIAIAYGGNKSYGIMNDIGISEYVIPIESVKEKTISEMIDNLSSNHLTYINKLQKYKENLHKMRKEMINDLKVIVF